VSSENGGRRAENATSDIRYPSAQRTEKTVKRIVEMEITLKISRFDPDKDNSPYLQEFKLDLGADKTVLDSLFLAWEQDPSLSFRRSCRSAICGSCAVAVNGRPSLACQTLIGKAMENADALVIEPLPRFRQLKDLVVDLEPFFESLKAALPWLVPRADYDGKMSPAVARKLEDPATCILCGVCNSAMDENGAIRPAALVKAVRLAMDPRDALGLSRISVLETPPEILKLFIKQLPDTCPKGIRIAEMV
jgi:succinate dehydrogenase / fumarate reductase iron-sulfur subunit